MLRFSLIILCIVSLTGCITAPPNIKNNAPVVDLDAEYAKQQGYYVVKPNETLFLIAWRLDMDFQQLAAINKLKAPYSLKVGQRLYLTKSSKSRANMPSTTSAKAVSEKTIAREYQPAKKTASDQQKVSSWIWPAKGKVIDKYSSNNKGINIAGSTGEPVLAAAAGEVVYAGNGLKAYGNLIIIKHNDTYLSAYAHNNDILVKDGQRITQGQTIAHMGDTGTNKVMLHFEIRKYGKPVNPLQYLR